MKQTKKYYVYYLIDPRDDQPFYVGKGKRARLYNHVREVLNESYKVNTPKVQRIQEIIKQGRDVTHKIVKYFNTSKMAQRFEIKEIKRIGRADLGTGPLLNLKSGDEKPIRKERPVCQYNRFLEKIATYPSTNVAAEKLGIKWPSSLANAIRGRIPSYKGFLWCYENEKPKQLTKITPVYKWSLGGKLLARYENSFRAAEDTNCGPAEINKNIKNKKGTIKRMYVFSREEFFPGVYLKNKIRAIRRSSTQP